MGFGVLIRNLYRLYRILKTRNWPTVSGTIHTSRVEEAFKAIGDNGDPIYIFRPEVLYRYEVNGQEYSVRYDFPDWSSFQSDAIRVILKYPLGTRVRVFYNPKSPGKSTLSVGRDQIPTSEWVTIIVVFAFCALIFWMAIKV